MSHERFFLVPLEGHIPPNYFLKLLFGNMMGFFEEKKIGNKKNMFWNLFRKRFENIFMIVIVFGNIFEDTITTTKTATMTKTTTTKTNP